MNNKIEGALKNTGMSQENYLKCANVIDLEIIKLEQKLAKAVDGLKFYADKDNYRKMEGEYGRSYQNYHALITEEDCDNYIGGKFARQILKELGE